MIKLTEDIQRICDGLRAGRFQNEAAVSQGIVLRLLRALGWPTDETRVVCPEFALQGRRVDFALCHPDDKPRIFIEVKQVGLSDGAERQLFEYAFHTGVPLVILTDGQEWSFFLPGELGNYAERRVYKLDLLEREIGESMFRLERYLSYEAACSGDYLDSARADYQNIARAREIGNALPKAWLKLIEEEDELLLELVATRAEDLCGYRPDVDTVARFLHEHVRSGSMPGSPSVDVKDDDARPASVASPTSRTNSVGISSIAPSNVARVTGSFGFSIKGGRRRCRNGRDVLVSLIEELARQDPSFLDRFASLPRHGRTRRYIARERSELYPDRPDLAQEFSVELQSGYWLGVNVGRKQIERIVTMACDVAGLRYGTDVVLDLG